MILTARQLEHLHRAAGANGQLTLPYQARLTPLAADYVRARKLTLGYSNVEAPAAPSAVVPPAPWGTPQAVPDGGSASGKAAAFAWWCDGPCGPAKAAMAMLAKEAPLKPIDIPPDPRQTATVVKAIAAQVKSSQLVGAVLLVQSGAAAMVLANRCPSLRAVVGTCLDAVEQGLRLVGANVLVVEYPHLSLQQTRNVVGRFLRGPRSLSDEMKQLLTEVASCG